MNRVLVIAVHPDDETLGCGGTLLKHKANNDEIHWLIASDMKESEGFNKSIIKKRRTIRKSFVWSTKRISNTRFNRKT